MVFGLYQHFRFFPLHFYKMKTKYLNMQRLWYCKAWAGWRQHHDTVIWNVCLQQRHKVCIWFVKGSLGSCEWCSNKGWRLNEKAKNHLHIEHISQVPSRFLTTTKKLIWNSFKRYRSTREAQKTSEHCNVSTHTKQLQPLGVGQPRTITAIFRPEKPQGSPRDLEFWGRAFLGWCWCLQSLGRGSTKLKPTALRKGCKSFSLGIWE